jgi:hypothetical protein
MAEHRSRKRCVSDEAWRAFSRSLETGLFSRERIARDGAAASGLAAQPGEVDLTFRFGPSWGDRVVL